MADGIEEQLVVVEKSLRDVSELLMDTPSKEDFSQLSSRLDQLETISKSTSSQDDLEVIVKNAVAAAVKPLEDRIAELEDSPVVKGVQDFDLAKAAQQKKIQEPQKVDVLKGVILSEYAGLRR